MKIISLKLLVLMVLATLSAAVLSVGCDTALGVLLSDPDVGADPESLTFTTHLGENDVNPQEIDANCMEHYPSNEYERNEYDYFDCTADVHANQPWIDFEPASIDGEGTITVTVNPEGLEEGIHKGKITLHSKALIEEGGDTVYVTLEILAPKEEDPEEKISKGLIDEDKTSEDITEEENTDHGEFPPPETE